MGLDVFGPTRHVTISHADGGKLDYDVLSLPQEFGLSCPWLTRLSERFYQSTIVSFADGQVHALCNEVIQLLTAYRARKEPEMIMTFKVRAQDPLIRREIIEKVMHRDEVFGVLEEFRLLCEEAIAAQSDVRCEGD